MRRVAHRALGIPELIHDIMSFADRHSLTVAALVCSLWYPNTLDGIWRDCKLFDLLGTVCNMRYDERSMDWVCSAPNFTPN